VKHAAHTDVAIHFDRITEPDTGSALTARAFARYRHTEQVDSWWEVSIGPGTGPHMGRDISTLRRWAWALHHLADALTEHTTQPAEAVDDPQLTLADAPVADGHTPTIRIGA
jgi:hypothetical protein